MDLLTYATFKVVIDTLAWFNAILTVGGDAPEDEFRAAMKEFKAETGSIIEEVVKEIIDEQNAKEDTPAVDALPFEEEE